MRLQENSQTQREKGTYFETLTQHYLTTEPQYAELYQEVLTFADWVEKYQPEGTSKNDTGIDLVAVTFEDTFTAIQCKNYSADYRIQKSDIDSFFTASGKKDFSHRLIITTTNYWSENAEKSLADQHIPVNIINRSNFEESVIDWQKYEPKQPLVLRAKKELREHQIQALKKVKDGLATADRGKLIMACGTGKTFTSLKIAETMAGQGKSVLFLVPSLALLSQTLTEWTQESDVPLHSFAVCSDSDVGKQSNDDLVQTKLHELSYPATTDARSLIRGINCKNADEAMTVIFSTYHSIDVIHQAQKLGLNSFDLVICDEAHRTTGHTFEDERESAFVRIHNNDYIQAKKRLYMTATPRIYTEDAKKSEGVEVYSMDDTKLFGKELHTITFSKAVKQGLLVDYKVLVLAVEEAHINRRLQYLLNAEGNEIQVDDAAKIVGCWKALSKYGVEQDLADDYQPMKRAVAFCQVIEKNYKGNKHKVSSKAIAEMFSTVVEAYQQQEIASLEESGIPYDLNQSLQLKCEAEHVDGSMNASEKAGKIGWLKSETEYNTCRILSNVRCLSEGVDVPALDAVLFLTARNSQIDVVQSVGRVMRKAEGKKRGYVILPVVIPAGKTPEEALDNNENYKVVWQVLNALRSHDDRFDAMINKMQFDGAAKDKIEIEVISEVSKILKKQPKDQHKKKKKYEKSGRNQHNIGGKGTGADFPTQEELEFEIGEIERALVTKIVKKCGNRMHWEEWAADVAKIAQTHIDRIKAILENPNNQRQITAFNAFAAELRDDLNNAISDDEVIEMLAQHLITKPVFDALFANDNFTEHNPMSKALSETIAVLQGENIANAETKQLQEFYESIQQRISNIKTPEGRQLIIKELYDNFFNQAFPKMAERLGIVYTPIEVVDFIIRSVEDVLQNEFNASLANKGVQILDPFTGTGTFITRLLQSGIIPPEKLPQKYSEIHANEIVLLAYYIAAINIESVYHALLAKNNENPTAYHPFNGICLTDTFQMYEKEDLIDQILVENSERRKRQKELDIQVIIGNPPYSVGQTSANDNNQNINYPKLEKRIEETYVYNSSSNNNKSMYDSYIKAIRWASDRIGNKGVIGFITNSGFIENNSADGLRKSLYNEFDTLYIFNLRGSIRGKSGNIARKEGGNIFDIMTGVAISILIKNRNRNRKSGSINFYDIGDYLNKKDKLTSINDLRSIDNIRKKGIWEKITPNEFNDWIKQRDPNFNQYISLGGDEETRIFSNHTNGLQTNRDAWVYNFSSKEINKNVQITLETYNQDRVKVIDKNDKNDKIDDLITLSSTKIAWSRGLKNLLKRNKDIVFNIRNIRSSISKPYTKQNVYFSRDLNEYVYQLPKIFPDKGIPNKLIYITSIGNLGKPFSVLMTNLIPHLKLQENGQGFPLYLYEKIESENTTNGDLFAENGKTVIDGYERKDAITDKALKHFTEFYGEQENIQKEDIFYYIYGLLHSEDYREKYADNLSKQLPRIPRVKSAEDFWAFSNAGRELAHYHLNFETVPMYEGVLFKGGLQIENDRIIGGVDNDFYVEKMKHPKRLNLETGKNEDDPTKVIYNKKFTLENIPEEAYTYVVNGKPALEWVIERQSVKTDKASGIINDANDWAIETMQNPRYPMELFLRVVTVSLETNRIVSGLPKLVI
ncbi:DEAD/DEAH box helicase [Mannheimia pernigra]|nr:DEAD/DEAH box helicase [Mannheimia pernigra]